jgi:hypothetical protein
MITHAEIFVEDKSVGQKCRNIEDMQISPHKNGWVPLQPTKTATSLLYLPKTFDILLPQMQIF